MEPSHAELMALWKVCKDFVEKYKISCPEGIYQRDSIMVASPELVEDVCDVVGYVEYEE